MATAQTAFQLDPSNREVSVVQRRAKAAAAARQVSDANVLLDGDDFARWRKAKRPDLAGKAYIKRARDGKVTLRFADSGACQHLGRDNKCRIYAIRPDNCSVFVVGSEACLAAREDTLRLRDG